MMVTRRAPCGSGLQPGAGVKAGVATRVGEPAAQTVPVGVALGGCVLVAVGGRGVAVRVCVPVGTGLGVSVGGAVGVGLGPPTVISPKIDSPPSSLWGGVM